MKNLIYLVLCGKLPVGAVREKLGESAGLFGVFVSLLLGLVKLFAGLVSGAVSVVADAVNNLTDCASGMVTFLGFRIANKPADEDHPYGHARSEYIAAFLTAAGILLLAFEMFVSCVRRLFAPAAPSMSPAALWVLSIALVLKVLLWIFYRRVAGALTSDALLAAAKDSLGDALFSSAVLLSCVFSAHLPVYADALVGALIAVCLFVAGARMAVRTLQPLLGQAPPRELVERMQEKILSYENVLGLHDLLVHSYGISRIFASVHVEFDSALDLMYCHDVIDTMERDFRLKEGVELVVHLDPVVTSDALAAQVRESLQELLCKVDAGISLHDFRAVYFKSHTKFIFDVLAPATLAVPDAKLCALCREHLKEMDESYTASITVDRGFVATSSEEN